MSTKQIIVLIAVIFLAFVGYKLIASNIQENKEKAVLLEKAQLQALEKEPLNQCIDAIDIATEAEVKQMREIYSPSKEEYESCIQNKNHGRTVNELIASGKMTIEEYCKPPSFEEQNTEEQKIRDRAKIEKDECYKRYK